MNGNNRNLVGRFFKIDSLLRRYHHNKRYGVLGETGRGQGRVLAILKLKPEITQKDLGYLLDVRPQSLGELLGKLEKRGFITRTADEADKRIMVIKLTEAGKAAAEKLDTDKDKASVLFEDFTEEEKDNMAKYLDKLIVNMEKRLEGSQMSEEEFKAHKHGEHSHRDIKEFFKHILHGHEEHGHGKHHHHHHGQGCACRKSHED